MQKNVNAMELKDVIPDYGAKINRKRVPMKS
jgi:hypothetical protein